MITYILLLEHRMWECDQGHVSQMRDQNVQGYQWNEEDILQQHDDDNEDKEHHVKAATDKENKL